MLKWMVNICVNETERQKVQPAFADDKKLFPLYFQSVLRKLPFSLPVFKGVIFHNWLVRYVLNFSLSFFLKPLECVTTGGKMPSLSEWTFGKSLFLLKIQTSLIWFWRCQGIYQ